MIFFIPSPFPFEINDENFMSSISLVNHEKIFFIDVFIIF